MTEITDSVLINNLYRILCLPESGLSEFREIFEEIGILSEVENGEIRHEQIRRINEWIERNRGSDEIRLIECLEKFRELSKGEGNFNEQLKVTENVIKYLLKLLTPPQLAPTNIRFKPYIEEIWGYLKETQEHALRIAEFRRDNIIHQFRVFLLGCYILYRLYDESREYIMKCFRKDLRLICKCLVDKELIVGTRPEMRRLQSIIEEVGFREILFMWMFSAIFHDIGKPIDDAEEEIKGLIKTYKIEKGIDIDKLVFIVDNLKIDRNKVMEFIEQFVGLLRYNDKINFCKQIRKFLYNRTGSGKKWDHGVLSATMLHSPLTREMRGGAL